MGNSIKVMYIPKAEYTEMTLTYPFVLEKREVMVLFVSQHYQVRIEKDINSIHTSQTQNAEAMIQNGFKVSDIETFDDMFVAIQTDIRNIEDSIFEIVLKERNPAEWAMYVADKNEQQAIDNHENN
jgi:hypothetical protein